ncbi:hypothetical protein P879_02590 [Paragonimus westermani]|uniref:Uncharacterized protein n=1 Tax=Paragonimus westermani TaxID=34504 RepID=A0A8T0DER5_9TREM|nr:hypothetical protein P879_02590 [Paragonimus westermani]
MLKDRLQLYNVFLRYEILSSQLVYPEIANACLSNVCTMLVSPQQPTARTGPPSGRLFEPSEAFCSDSSKKFYIGSGEVCRTQDKPLAPIFTSLTITPNNSMADPLESDKQDPLYRETSLQFADGGYEPLAASTNRDLSETVLKRFRIQTATSHSPQPPSPNNVVEEPIESTSFQNRVEVDDHRPIISTPCPQTPPTLEEGPIPNTILTDRWRWLIVVGSFLCIFIVEGLCFSYGLYLYEMIAENQFTSSSLASDPHGRTTPNTPRSLAALSLPGALLYGTCVLIGPLAGALVNRFSYRSVAIVGALIATVCMFLSGLLIYDLIWFSFLYGLMGGIGCGLVYLPAITVVGHWFEQHRAFVVGFVMCGGGCGAGFLAILIRSLSRAYTWRGTVILMAGLFAQTLLGLALFRSMHAHERIRLARWERLQRRSKLTRTHTNAQSATETKQKKSGHGARLTDRRHYFQRGSIMARIIEEKSRQRTTSTGSLDGMVITRENELVALSSPEAYLTVRAAAIAYVAHQQHQQTVATNQEEVSPATANKPGIHGMGMRGQTSLQPLQEEAVPPTIASPSSPDADTSCLAVLPPPVQFSRTAVRRIACALLNKLQAAQLLPCAGTFGPPSERSSRVFNTRFSRVSSEHQPVESWSTYDAPRHSAATQSFETTEVTVDSKQPFPRKTSLHVPRESGLRANSFVMPGSELNMATQLGRLTNERTSIQHVPKRPMDWRFRLLNQPDLSNTPSQLASMASLDSRTDQLIQQELQNLPLDSPTKASIMRAVRIELGRPRYQLDLFYPGSRRSSDRTAASFALEGRVGEMEAPHPDLNKPAGDVDGMLYRTRFASVYREPRDSNTNEFACDQPSHGQQQLAPESGPWTDHTWIESVLEADAQGNEVWNYLRDMLDMRLLRSCTFIILLIACSLNMLVLPVPYYFLPLLLEFGGRECVTNRVWCPYGLPHQMQLEPGWLHSAVRSSASSTSIRFLDPGSVLLVIGLANATGRLLAAVYIDKGVNASRRPFQRCSLLNNPILLNNLSLVLCGLSLACFPLAIHGLYSSPVDAGSSAQPVQLWSMEFRLCLFYSAAFVYGVANAMALSLRSVILVDLFGLRRLTNAFGYLMLVQGLSVMLGPPIFGYFCDLTCEPHLSLCGGHYQPVLTDHNVPVAQPISACAKSLMYAFYACAILFVLTSLLFLPLRWLVRHDPCRYVCPISSPFHKPDVPRPHCVVLPSQQCGQPMDETYSMESAHSAHNKPHYDPQETQTTHILSDSDRAAADVTP